MTRPASANEEPCICCGGPEGLCGCEIAWVDFGGLDQRPVCNTHGQEL